MKRYSKLLAILLAILTASVLLLTGCGQTAGTTSGTTAAPAAAQQTSAPAKTTAPAAPAAKPTTISFWQFWDMGNEADSLKPVVDGFMSENADIKVDITKLGWGDGLTKITTAIGAGAAPDVLELGSTWVGMFSTMGALSDLTSYITPDVKDALVNWQLGTVGNKIFAYPWAVGTRALAINNNVFKKAGLDPVANAPKTWNDLLNDAKTIKQKTGLPGFNIAAGDVTGDYQTFGDFLYSEGSGMIVTNSDGKAVCGVDSDASKKALNFLVSLKPYCSIDSEANTMAAFEADKVGMMVVGSYLTSDFAKNNIPLSGLSYVPFPACPDTGKGLAFLGAEVLTVPAQSKNKEAAAKFVTYMASEKGSMAFCKAVGYSVMPSTKTLAQNPVFANPQDNTTKYAKAFVDVISSGATWVPDINPNIEKIGARVSQMIQEIFLNGSSVDKAAASCASDCNKLYLQ